jgi:hypothetical protein
VTTTRTSDPAAGSPSPARRVRRLRLLRGVIGPEAVSALVAEAINTARACGATGEIVVRMDSAFYSRNSLWAVRRGGARFSVTARMDAKVQSACQAIGDDKWVDIKYPQAIWDEDQQVWISDAQIAETTYTAFGSTRQAITARLIVRRVKRLDRNQVPGQDELFTAYRYVLGAGDGAAGELVEQRLLQQCPVQLKVAEGAPC